ncbi:hypothetical protein ACOMHN_031796 [Nucella lapillus]
MGDHKRCFLLLLILCFPARASSNDRGTGNPPLADMGSGSSQEHNVTGSVLNSNTASPVSDTLDPDRQTPAPTDRQTPAPSDIQTPAPSDIQTPAPTDRQTPAPSDIQTPAPSDIQTPAPSDIQTTAPSDIQTTAPSDIQTTAPTDRQTPAPSDIQTTAPSDIQTTAPTDRQTPAPSDIQTPAPTDRQTPAPSDIQTTAPSDIQTTAPTDRQTPAPSDIQTPAPTDRQTPVPSDIQTTAPSDIQTTAPSDIQTPAPSDIQTPAPTDRQTPASSEIQTTAPTDRQTPAPSDIQTPAPSDRQTTAPTDIQTPAPSDIQTTAPTDRQSPVPSDIQTPAADHSTSKDEVITTDSTGTQSTTHDWNKLNASLVLESDYHSENDSSRKGEEPPVSPARDADPGSTDTPQSFASQHLAVSGSPAAEDSHVFEENATTLPTVQSSAVPVLRPRPKMTIPDSKSYTHNVFIEPNCTRHFSRTDHKSSIAECSLPAIFQSYPTPVNMDLFKSVIITAEDLPLPKCDGDLELISRSSNSSYLDTNFAGSAVVCDIIARGAMPKGKPASSEHPPLRLTSGKWVCSGGRGSILAQHFLCRADSHCDNDADALAGACPPVELCGYQYNSFEIDGNCYHYKKQERVIKKKEAENICRENNGKLVSLNTEREWRRVTDYWVGITDSTFLLVGLQQSSFHPRHIMYFPLWQWSDGTIAYYLKLNTTGIGTLTRPYCAVFEKKRRDLTIQSCRRGFKTGFLCETTKEPSRKSQITLPSPTTALFPGGMSHCANKQVTHTFLLCHTGVSHCNGNTEREIQRCFLENPLVAETTFACRKGRQHVPYSLLCDHYFDCEDRSDEDFCAFPHCPAGHFSCAGTQQCFPLILRCDGILHCSDDSDEAMCMNSQDNVNSIVLPPAVIRFMETDTITFTAVNASLVPDICPETHFQCPEGYCLPVYVRCNGVLDCPDGEDEAGCDSYICPGFYRCREASICVHASHLCDGRFQCPRHDDELMCNIACPQNCLCMGLAFSCREKFSANAYLQLRYLNADHTGMTLQDVTDNYLLVRLSLRYCGIQEIGVVNLLNVQSLDLSHNVLTSFSGVELKAMTNLRLLSLAFNELISLNSIDHFNTFPSLLLLDLSGGGTREITNTSFLPFPNIQNLNLSGSRLLEKVLEPGFSTLPDLQVLDISECPVTEFYGDMLKRLSQLENIYGSKFQMCCPRILPEEFDPENCKAPADEVSSCAVLLREDTFRIVLAIYAFLALVGNLYSFVYRVIGKGVTTNLGCDTFVAHLCVSDFVMGIYLAIVGIADRVYYGTYEWNETQWKQSFACKMAGLLSFLSREMSAFLICLITLERLLIVLFPQKNIRFSLRSAQLACFMGWVVGVLLAAIPLLPFSPPWDFYGQTGICIPLPATGKVFAGFRYAFAVTVAFNFVLFLLIAVSQCLIFWRLHSQEKIESSHRKKAKDMAIARRLLAVVMTDFLCWFPIGLLGLMARNGVPISGDVNVAMAIFVLPFNSAINPFLHTFHMLLEQCRSSRAQQQQSEDGRETTSQTCSTCAKHEQQCVSYDAQSLTGTERLMSTSTVSDDDNADEEVVNFIATVLAENQVTPECLLIHAILMDQITPQCTPKGSDNPTMFSKGSDNPTMCPKGSDNPTMCPKGSDNPTMCPKGSDNPTMCPKESDNPTMCSKGSDNPTMCPKRIR